MEKNEMYNIYSSQFYNSMHNSDTCTNLTSATEIVPYVLKLIPSISSYIDIGGAIGTWAYEFKKNGVNEVLVLDGKWVDKNQLLINKNEFEEYDLTTIKDNHYEPNHRYDLAACLEVAEHIDQKYADDLVELLTRCSDVVMFGAAIPYQGGIHHVNEQFPSYWKEKFKKLGYIAIDPIRGMFWNNPKVLKEYSQNILFYIKKGVDIPELRKFFDIPFVVDFNSIYIHNNIIGNSWKEIFEAQYHILSAIKRKLFHQSLPISFRTRTSQF